MSTMAVHKPFHRFTGIKPLEKVEEGLQCKCSSAPAYLEGHDRNSSGQGEAKVENQDLKPRPFPVLAFSSQSTEPEDLTCPGAAVARTSTLRATRFFSFSMFSQQAIKQARSAWDPPSPDSAPHLLCDVGPLFSVVWNTHTFH